MLLEELISFGFDNTDAEKLVGDDRFYYKRKSSQELKDRFNKISIIYGCTFDDVKKAILDFPPFASYDHERVIRQAVEVYGIDNEDKIKKAVLTFPQFASLDHERVIRQAVEVYGIDNEDKIKKSLLTFPQFGGFNHERVIRQAVEIYGADNEDKIKKSILNFPPFAGLDHERVVRQGIEIYGADNEDKIKKAVLTHPQFAGLDHERVIRQAVEIYGTDNKDKIKKAILTHPPFAGLDHKRVVRQKTRLGRLAGLEDQDTINHILDIPFLAGYRAKRYLAALDIGRQLEKEGFPQDKKMLKAFLVYFTRSPYVPGTNRKRISQVINYKEPRLLKSMRIKLEKDK